MLALMLKIAFRECHRKKFSNRWFQAISIWARINSNIRNIHNTPDTEQLWIKLLLSPPNKWLSTHLKKTINTTLTLWAMVQEVSEWWEKAWTVQRLGKQPFLCSSIIFSINSNQIGCRFNVTIKWDFKHRQEAQEKGQLHSKCNKHKLWFNKVIKWSQVTCKGPFHSTRLRTHHTNNKAQHSHLP